MKLRSTLLALACLLPMGSLASAAPPATPSNEAMTTQLSAETSPGCSAADLPFLSPAPTEEAGVVCGSCSVSSCQGKNANAVCAFISGQVYTCLAGPTCTDGVTRQCGCFRFIP